MVYLEYVCRNKDAGGQDVMIPRYRYDTYSLDPTLRNLLTSINEWCDRHPGRDVKISLYSSKADTGNRNAEVHDLTMLRGVGMDISSFPDEWLDLKVDCDFVIGFQKLDIWYVYLLEGQKFPKIDLKSPLECP